MRITRIPWISGAVSLSLASAAFAGPSVLGTVAKVGLVGDANGDGIANSLDAAIVQQHLGQAGTLAQGDFDGNGIVNSNDLTLLNNNLQRSLPSVYFGKIADNTTAVPAGSGNFSLLSAPTVDRQGNLAFLGSGPSNWGVYEWSAGTVTKIADNNTNIPSGTGQFTNFGLPSITTGKVDFAAVGASQEGIYNYSGGTLTNVINKSTARPDGGTFASIGDPTLVNTAVAFVSGGGTTFGAYSLNGGSLAVVANTATAIPGGTGTFGSLTNAVSDGTSTWFVGSATGQFGIYKRTGNTITTVIDRNSVIDGTSLKFNRAGNLSVDGSNLSFGGKFGGVQGIYALIGTSLDRVADLKTYVPGGIGQFSSFGMSSIGGSSVAFVGQDAKSNYGIYAWIDGQLERIIDSSVTLNGKTITQLDLSRNAVMGNKIVFNAIFSDNTSALYSASLLPTLVPGDVNDDGVVNSTDLNILEKNMGLSGGRSRGDLNGDGKIDFHDFQTLEQNFGKSGTPALLGDTDGNGTVDATDLKTFFANNGKYGSAAQGDFNGDGKIDFGDFQYLEMNFGATAGAYNPFGTGAATAEALPSGSVPEPTGLMVGAIGLALMAGRRRRRD